MVDCWLDAASELGLTLDDLLWVVCELIPVWELWELWVCVVATLEAGVETDTREAEVWERGLIPLEVVCTVLLRWVAVELRDGCEIVEEVPWLRTVVDLVADETVEDLVAWLLRVEDLVAWLLRVENLVAWLLRDEDLVAWLLRLEDLVA